MTRRTLLIGAGAGFVGVLLASCTPEPEPTPTRTPSPSPQPTGAAVVPLAFARSAWTTDPFSLGAASFTPVGVQKSVRVSLAQPVVDRVFFAGEATDAEQPGTLDAALRSGRRAAAEIRVAAGPGERIAIIGAGLSGAAAVSSLAGADLEVTVFEARERVGGRILSFVDEKAWPFPVQLGGWLHSAQDAEWIEQMSALDIRSATLASSEWRSGDGVVEPASAEAVASAVLAAQELPSDVSLAQALTDAGSDLDDPALVALLAAISAGAGADAEELSSWFPPAPPAAEPIAPLADLDAVIRDLLGEARVSLSSPIARIVYDDAGVSLAMATGESLSFDRVIVTVPLGVLQSEGVEFSPALPFGHRGAIASLGMGRIETVWLRLDEPLLDSEAAIWHVVGGDALIRSWMNLAPVTGEAVLVGVVGGAAAEEFAALDDDGVLEAAIASLAPFMQADVPG